MVKNRIGNVFGKFFGKFFLKIFFQSNFKIRKKFPSLNKNSNSEKKKQIILKEYK